MTDTLYYNGDNKRLNVRYADILKPKPVDNRTGDEIALEVIQNIGLKVK